MSDAEESQRSEVLGDGQTNEDRFFSPQASTVYFSAESLGTFSYQDVTSREEIHPKQSTGTQTRRSFVYALKMAEEGLKLMPGFLLPAQGSKADATVDAQDLPQAEERPKTIMFRESSTDAPTDSLLQLSTVKKNENVQDESSLGEQHSEPHSEQTLEPNINIQDEEDSEDKKEDTPLKGILKYTVPQQDNQEEPLLKSTSTQSEFDHDDKGSTKKRISIDTSRSISPRASLSREKDTFDERNQEESSKDSDDESIAQKPSVIFKDSNKRDSKSSLDESKHVEILPTTSKDITEKPSVHEYLPELIEQASFIDLRQPEKSHVEIPLGKVSLSSRFSVKNATYLTTGNAFIHLVLPPDGGYGWIIVVMSFFAQLIVDGIILGLGILLPDVNKEFQVAPALLSLLSSVQLGFYLLTGPLSSALINKMGFRPVVLIGSCISTSAVLVASYCPNFLSCLIFYSLIGGPSMSMIWTSSQLIIGFYFEKYRPIANGLAVSGAGAGMVVFGIMNALLVDEIGWRNMFRIEAAFLLLTSLIGITFIEVKPIKIPVVYPIETDSDYDSDEVLSGHRYSIIAGDPLMKSSNIKIQDSIREKRKSSFWSRLWHQLCFCCYKTKKNSMNIESDFILKPDPIERKDLYYTGQLFSVETEDHPEQMQFEIEKGTTVEVLAPVNKRKSIAFHLLESQRSQVVTSKNHMSYQELKDQKKVKYPLIHYISPKNWISPKITRALRVLFDFRLLRNTEFKVLFLSAILFPMGFNIPFLYSRSRAEVPNNIIFWITPTIGFSNIIVRILSGFLAYQYRHYTTKLCGAGMIFGGFFVSLSAFYGVNKPWFQLLYAFCYGIAPAFYSTLRALIYVHCVGLEKLTNAFGITAMGMGLGVFIGTTIAGLLNEFTYSYSAAFAFAGLCIIAAGLLKLLVVPILRKRRRQRRPTIAK